MSIVYAFVFARGGSKGLPRKNILPLGGIPLIAHSIEQAKKIDAVAKVYVSTDDAEIMDIAREFGAEVIRRPEELASDTASEIDAWKHAINYLESEGEIFDVFLSLPATSPLRNISDIQACLDALDDDTDAVITVTPASRSPYFNMVAKNDDGTCGIMITSGGYTRRQDAPKAYEITTVAYVLRPEYILSNKGIFDGRVKPIVVSKESAVDIDDCWDFKFAEVMYELVMDKKNANA